ncbi:hypothetical protein [Tranquillimonas alkanivorans]|uniref:Lipoprotein n=1 Tax=Tranquillimonas alkanivorans TaxID=441119 RepID=A0A1I5SHK7_9RHOB|nr:hypothetical protein [Tranquillimonas alkanivorans]SFP70240.1 hypothetical protein SAMN04488047_11122 [Tranquillimonas alkanivorans]
MRASVATVLAGAVAACTGATDGPEAARAAFAPRYEGVQTRLLDADLVNFLVEMRGARSADDVGAYAECAAAQYALIRGFGFARHVRTNVDEEGGLWRGDAVYTVSPTLPDGARTLDAEVVVEACVASGIPTV